MRNQDTGIIISYSSVCILTPYPKYDQDLVKTHNCNTQVPVKAAIRGGFCDFCCLNEVGLTCNPLPQRSGCYENSVHLNMFSFQFQQHTSGLQPKNNRLCYCCISLRCVRSGWSL